jgi:hypothetical protein
LDRLRGTSAMGCCDGFFMGNSLSDPEDLLIPFFGHVDSIPLPVSELATSRSSKAREEITQSRTN